MSESLMMEPPSTTQLAKATPSLLHCLTEHPRWKRRGSSRKNWTKLSSDLSMARRQRQNAIAPSANMLTMPTKSFNGGSKTLMNSSSSGMTYLTNTRPTLMRLPLEARIGVGPSASPLVGRMEVETVPHTSRQRVPLLERSEYTSLEMRLTTNPVMSQILTMMRSTEEVSGQRPPEGTILTRTPPN